MQPYHRADSTVSLQAHHSQSETNFDMPLEPAVSYLTQAFVHFIALTELLQKLIELLHGGTLPDLYLSRFDHFCCSPY